MTPSLDQLRQALSAAGTAHHDYEQGVLNGQRDELWSGFYAAYVLGKFGNFATATELSRWLEAAPSGGDWAAQAANFVLAKLK